MTQEALSLPETTVSEILGLLEIISDYGGKEDIAKLADDFDLEIDEILPEAQAAELLGFAIIENGDIKLTEEGKKIIKSSIKERRRMFRDQILKLEIFKKITSFIVTKKGKIKKGEANEFLKLHLSGDPKTNLRDIINWGRYAGILTYNSEKDELSVT